MYLSHPLELIWAYDIEGDGLPSNQVWCMVAVNAASKDVVRLLAPDIPDWIAERKAEGCKFVAHNGIGYDAPTLNRLLKTSLTISDLIDTMLMSMMFNPSLKNGHSLESWGERLKYPKTDFKDFSKLTPEMLDYCENDAQLCLKIYLALRKKMLALGFTNRGLDIEHRSWQLIQRQTADGYAFNLPEAHILYAKLRKIENDLQEEIYKFWPPELLPVRTFAKAKKKDGTYSASFERHTEEYPKIVENADGSYTAWDYVAFNIGSPNQRTERLLELGWKPREFTEKGSPQPTRKGQLSPSLQEFVANSGKDEVKLIAQWIEINSRANMINTWMEAYNHDTKCIHGTLWLANTLRYRHSNPNTANIPAVRLDGPNVLRGADGVYTYEARNLWTVRSDDRVLVGVDAKGIQLRVLAHYLNNPKFTEAVLEGDPHTYNQEIGGFRTRADAKTFIYAFLLGAGDAKVGEIIGGSTRDGRDVKTRFIGNFPGLSDLLDDLERQVERTGRIRLCDGTPLSVTAPHTRLGYLLQGDESRIMKQASIYRDQELRRRKLDVIKVGDIHDEWQNDAYKPHAEEFAYDLCPAVFKRSGESFGYRLPIECDAKIGLTWAETH